MVWRRLYVSASSYTTTRGHFRMFRKFARARAHPETRLAVAEPSDGTQEGGKEDGSRKPTGAEFASGKATSDYFI